LIAGIYKELPAAGGRYLGLSEAEWAAALIIGVVIIIAALTGIVYLWMRKNYPERTVLRLAALSVAIAGVAAFLIWEFSILAGGSGTRLNSIEKKYFAHFHYSLRYRADAARLYRSALSANLENEYLNSQLLEELESALSNARIVTDSVLKKVHRDLAGRFRNEFQKSLELSIDAVHNLDAAGMNAADYLYDKFIAWCRKENIMTTPPEK
jgi:hypothetical protein